MKKHENKSCNFGVPKRLMDPMIERWQSEQPKQSADITLETLPPPENTWVSRMPAPPLPGTDLYYQCSYPWYVMMMYAMELILTQSIRDMMKRRGHLDKLD
jgi:hypothetical protein